MENLTPKEKAKELVNIFFRYSKGQTNEARWINAKDCAIITVNELIKNSHSDKRTEYWQQVKYQIIQLNY